MELPIPYSGFEKQRLSVKTAGVFGGWPKLLLNGKPAKNKKREFLHSRTIYSVKNDAGTDVEIKFEGEQIINPVPRILIGKDVIQPMPPYKWYEYVWLGWPLIFVVSGGALGGLMAALIITTNSRIIFRSKRNAFVRYGLTALVSVVILAAYLFLITLVETHSITALNNAIKANPNSPDLYSLRGSAYAGKGDFEHAISDLSVVIQLSPRDDNAYEGRGTFYLAEKKNDQAFADLNKAIEINPNNGNAYLARSSIYEERKQYDQAWADVHKAEELGAEVHSADLADLRKESGRDK